MPMVTEDKPLQTLEADYKKARSIMQSGFSRRHLSNAQVGKVIGALDELFDALRRQPQG
jgi:hypothetical protein